MCLDRIKIALSLLESGCGHFDIWYQFRSYPKMMRDAMVIKTKALINHDRVLNCEVTERKFV